jgi:hypothetical protein
MRRMFTSWLTNYMNPKKKELAVLFHPLNIQNCDVIHSFKVKFRIDNRNFQHMKNRVMCIIYLRVKFHMSGFNGLLVIS